jgi:tetratricopeptide (TPR) repeat protein
MGELLESESPQEALVWLHRGLEGLAGDSSVEEGALYDRVGSALIATGEYEQARSALERSLNLVPNDRPELRAGVLSKLGIIHCLQGQIERGKSFFLQAQAIYQRTLNHWQLVAIKVNLGLVMHITGDWPSAVAEYQQGLDLAKQLGNIVRQHQLALNLGALQMNLGDTDAAFAHLSQSLQLAQKYRLHENAVYTLASLADLHIRLADWPAAEHALTEAEALGLQLDIKHQLTEVYRGWVQVKIARNEYVSALEDAGRALDISRELEDPLAEGTSLRALGQALRADEQRAEALAALERSLALLSDDPYETARTQMQLGLALRDDGNTESGTAMLREARATFARLGAKRDLAEVDILLAE